LAILCYIIADSISLVYDSHIIHATKDAESDLDDPMVILLIVELSFWTMGHIFFYILTVQRYKFLYSVKKIQKAKYADCYILIVCVIALYVIISCAVTVIFGWSTRNLENNKGESREIPVIYFVCMFVLDLGIGLLLWCQLEDAFRNQFVRQAGGVVYDLDRETTDAIDGLTYELTINEDSGDNQISQKRLMSIGARLLLLITVVICCIIGADLFLVTYGILALSIDRIAIKDADELQANLRVLHALVIISCTVNSLCIYLSLVFESADKWYQNCCGCCHKRYVRCSFPQETAVTQLSSDSHGNYNSNGITESLSSKSGSTSKMYHSLETKHE